MSFVLLVIATYAFVNAFYKTMTQILVAQLMCAKLERSPREFSFRKSWNWALVGLNLVLGAIALNHWPTFF